MRRKIIFYSILAALLALYSFSECIAGDGPKDRYEFLDFWFDGSKGDFLKQAKSSRFVSVDENAKIVSMFGANWGLNIHKDSSGRIRDVVLLTSNTSDIVFSNAQRELIQLLGEPDLKDLDEERLVWYGHKSMPFRSIKFRHLHTAEGGWTFYVEYNLPE